MDMYCVSVSVCQSMADGLKEFLNISNAHDMAAIDLVQPERGSIYDKAFKKWENL